MIFIITGNRGIGKTTALHKYWNLCRSEGKNIYGILSTPLFDKKKIKNGFSALDLKSGDTWELARTDKELNGPVYGPYHFSTAGLSKANNLLQLSLKQKDSLIIVDEVGPLELTHKQGFYESLRMLDKTDPSNRIYFVIRSELIEEFAERFIAGKEYKVITINEENRDSIQLNF